MKKADGIELALLHALRYEEMTFKTSDTFKRWGINKEESRAVLKWMKARMEDIKERTHG
tara:strand:+ start:1618 stop:1794 length:177 start_codon:yes stop_codon:yes gene_type:complete